MSTEILGILGWNIKNHLRYDRRNAIQHYMHRSYNCVTLLCLKLLVRRP